MSATKREGGGLGRGSGRVRHCGGRVGSGQIIGFWSRVGSGPDPGGSGRVQKIGPGNNSERYRDYTHARFVQLNLTASG